ncbi:hypothetical protein KUA24_163 [Vibrio phage HNL01]|nr:hypothetical protein KUA24_163 [Vibrio phage HNL01]
MLCSERIDKLLQKYKHNLTPVGITDIQALHEVALLAEIRQEASLDVERVLCLLCEKIISRGG